MKTQTEQIAEHLVKAYPGSICSQDFARDIALQLPRVMNHLRYLPEWQVEMLGVKAKWGINLKSDPCKHPGTRQARDYKLTPLGYQRLVDALSQHFNKQIRSKEVAVIALPKQSWEEELIRVEKNGYVFWEKPENLKPKQEALF